MSERDVSRGEGIRVLGVELESDLQGRSVWISHELDRDTDLHQSNATCEMNALFKFRGFKSTLHSGDMFMLTKPNISRLCN